MTLVIKGLIIWESKCHQISPRMVSDGYVKYEEAKFHRWAIMQDFRDNEKKNKMAWILLVQNLLWVILVWDVTFFSIHCPDILHLSLSYVNITKSQKKRYCLLPKPNQVIGWHSWTYLPFELKQDLMETFSWIALTSISLLVAIVIKGLMIWRSTCTPPPPNLLANSVAVGAKLLRTVGGVGVA